MSVDREDRVEHTQRQMSPPLQPGLRSAPDDVQPHGGHDDRLDVLLLHVAPPGQFPYRCGPTRPALHSGVSCTRADREPVSLQMTVCRRCHQRREHGGLPWPQGRRRRRHRRPVCAGSARKGYIGRVRQPATGGTRYLQPGQRTPQPSCVRQRRCRDLPGCTTFEPAQCPGAGEVGHGGHYKPTASSASPTASTRRP